MKTLFLNFDKVLLITAPYLLLVSCLYYYGYWGELNIDAFNYFQIQDLVKGIAFPFRGQLFNVLYVTGGLFSVYVFNWLFIAVIHAIQVEKWRQRYRVGSLILIFTVLFGVPIWYYQHIKQIGYQVHNIPDSVNYWILFASMILSSLLANRFVPTDPKEARPWLNANMLTSIAMFAVFITTADAYALGYYNARRVVENISYDYADTKSMPDLALSQTYDTLKYLGKAGDTYFWLTMDNKQRFIVDKSKVPILVLKNYRKSTFNP